MKLVLSASIPAAAAFLAPVSLFAETAEADAPAEEMTIDWIQEIINGVQCWPLASKEYPLENVVHPHQAL